MLSTSRKTYEMVLQMLKATDEEHRLPEDSDETRTIFEKYEEGHQDREIISGRLNKKRRDWLIIADIYNNGEKSQKFHLINYIEFKLHDGSKPSDQLYDGRIWNAALYLYIRQFIYKDDIQDAYDSITDFYENNRDEKYSVSKMHSFFS